MINLITWNSPIYLIVTWVSIHYLLHALKQHTKPSPKRMPPGPMPWPIVANLLSLGTRPHESLASLSRPPSYGPLVSLQLGWVTAVMVSSLEAAREVLHRRDGVFATRAVGDTATVLHHHRASLVALPPALGGAASAGFVAPMYSPLAGTHLFVQDLFGGGTDTTSSTVERAMVELLRSSTKMEKARSEIEERVGVGNPVQEAHIAELPYLQAVVKETLRLLPPVPFLIPRKFETEVELCGFTLLKNTQVLVNVWAIGRDGDLWESPNSFEPERFLGLELDYRGHDFEFIPFGAGCRMCPGLPLAHRMVHLILGSLVHSFRWRIGHGLRPDEIDMDDKFGFTLKKAQPLYAIPERF